MPDTNDTTSAVIARLRAAYLEVALCESWLALDATRRAEARQRSQIAAAFAQARQRELSGEGRAND